MHRILAILLDASVITFAVSSMLSVGFGDTIQRLLAPMRSAWRVTRAILANFILVPLLARIVLQRLPLEFPEAIGLFLVATAAGAPGPRPGRCDSDRRCRSRRPSRGCCWWRPQP